MFHSKNILIITRGSNSFNSIINSFTYEDDKLIKGGSIKVLPLGFASSFLNISTDMSKNHKVFIHGMGLEVIANSSDKNDFESKGKFDYVVKHNGEEMYFVDLLDNDLMKMGDLAHYRKEDYEHDGRRILALTSPNDFHWDFHTRMLQHINHIDYIQIDPNDVVDFAHHLVNKNNAILNCERDTDLTS